MNSKARRITCIKVKSVFELDYYCGFCHAKLDMDDERVKERSRFAEWACYASRHLVDWDELDVLEPWASVCCTCAERLAGADWLEKARALIAEHDAFDANAKAAAAAAGSTIYYFCPADRAHEVQ